jgi:hypothetical protein
MFHYHKQIHAPIPDGQLCVHNCGRNAQYKKYKRFKKFLNRRKKYQKVQFVR